MSQLKCVSECIYMGENSRKDYLSITFEAKAILLTGYIQPNEKMTFGNHKRS